MASMRNGLRVDEVTITQLPTSSTRARNERALLATFWSLRVVHLGQAVACIVASRKAYRRPGLATWSLVAALGESVWLARRSRSQGRFDAPCAVVDAAVGTLLLATVGAATPPSARMSGLNWALPISVTSCVGLGLGMPGKVKGASGASAMAATYLRSTRGSRGTSRGQMISTVGNALMSYPGLFAVGNLAANLVRRIGTEVDEARRVSIEQASRLATERERNAQHRLLHDSALQTLEVVAQGRSDDPEQLRLRASREARILRRALRGEDLAVAGLKQSLGALVDKFEPLGLQIELVSSELTCDLTSAQTAALYGAAHEALTNVLKHAKTSSVVVRVADSYDRVTLTIRDHGRGFDPTSEAGYGTRESIIARMHDAGGKAFIHSSPGRGTKVELWLTR